MWTSHACSGIPAQPAAVAAAEGSPAVALLRVINAMHKPVEELDTALALEFDQHPQATVLGSLPVLGRVLAEVGSDPDRFTTADRLHPFAAAATGTRTTTDTEPPMTATMQLRATSLTRSPGDYVVPAAPPNMRRGAPPRCTPPAPRPRATGPVPRRRHPKAS